MSYVAAAVVVCMCTHAAFHACKRMVRSPRKHRGSGEASVVVPIMKTYGIQPLPFYRCVYLNHDHVARRSHEDITCRDPTPPPPRVAGTVGPAMRREKADGR